MTDGSEAAFPGSSARAGLAVFALAVVIALWLTVEPSHPSLRAVQLSLAVAAAGGALASRRWPVCGLVVATTTTLSAAVLGLTDDPFLLAGAAVFTVAERRGRRTIPWWIAVGGGGVAVVLAVVSIDDDGTGGGAPGRVRMLVLSAVVLAAAWALGVRSRQVREASTARAVAEERVRLSRDIHDTLSHSLAAIGVRAGVVAHVQTTDERMLRQTLHDIEEAARQALAQLAGLLERERSSLTPTDLRASIAECMGAVEAAGIRVYSHIDAAANDLAAPLREVVHRVVQESATNSIRHSGSSLMRVEVRVEPQRIDVHVRDDGRADTAGVRPGRGLAGMRERVEAVGGTLHLETRGGMHVRVTIPTGARETAYP